MDACDRIAALIEHLAKERSRRFASETEALVDRARVELRGQGRRPPGHFVFGSNSLRFGHGSGA